MIALQFRINDEEVIIAGANDLGVLTASVTAVGKLGSATLVQTKAEKPNHYTCHLGGLTARSSDNEHLNWLQHRELKVGDRVTIEILEVNETSPVVSSRPS